MKYASIVFLLIIWFSPKSLRAGDGEILFWDSTDNASSIYKINPDGSGLKEIIHNGSYPQWSPNKKMISYVSSSGDICIADSTGKEVSKIESVKATLGRKPLKTEIWGHAWSPDGKKIGFLSVMFRYLYIQVYDLDKQKIVMTFSKEIEKNEFLLSATIQFSPDSQKVLFSMQDVGDKSGIELLDIATKNKKMVSQGFYARYWGNRIFFIALEKEKTLFYISSEDGVQKEKIFESDFMLIPVSEIKSGKFFLHGFNKTNIQLYLFDLKNKKLSDLSSLTLFQPELSPDGEKALAFGLSVNGADAGYYIIELESRKTTLLSKILKERDRGYWWRLYFGNRKDYSWK